MSRFIRQREVMGSEAKGNLTARNVEIPKTKTHEQRELMGWYSRR